MSDGGAFPLGLKLERWNFGLGHSDDFLANDNHRTRTHLGLEKDTPDHRPVSGPPTGPIVEIPEVGGLHHRYERRAA